MSSESAKFRAGFARESITVYEPGTSPFGWGDTRVTIRGVARPLFARALVVEEGSSGRRIAYVCCDLGMISESVRNAVIAALGRPEHEDLRLDDHHVMITATHTHSGPSGFSTYFMYSCCAPGLSSRVRDTIVDGIVTAIRAAVHALVPARLHLHAEDVPLAMPIAWNRSIDAYSANRDVSPLPFERRDEAIDRTMTVLRVDSREGRPLGLVSWFAIHGTSMHHENDLLHGDNKGEASAFLERRAALDGNPDYVAIFAQGAAGDVSPNHRFEPARGLDVGRYDDDHESARFVGEIQARQAMSIARHSTRVGTEIRHGLEAKISRTDFFEAAVDPDFAFGREGLRTGPPRLGFHFACGTREGPGPLAFARSLSTPLAKARELYLRHAQPPRDESLHGAKATFVELGYGKHNRFFGLLRPPTLLLAALPNHHLSSFGRSIRESDASYAPWVPRMLPAQLLRIGPLVIAGMPNEPTVVAGRRVAEAVRRAIGLEHSRIVVNGYANAYASYVTTPEEYALQRYEGASTLFGQWSLPAWCTSFSALSRTMRVERRRQDRASALANRDC